MKPPLFWNNPPDRIGAKARMLAPLGALYARATARRVGRAADLTPSVPVICIGNLNAGGTGKTPTTIALAMRLLERGETPHVVSRGYGGSLTGPVRVVEKKHRAADTGDEPLLLAAFAPTWVARNRAEGVRAAQVAGASVILMDDGFQNPGVAKSLSIVVVDAAVGFGNGRVIPAGPLREPVTAGLARADFLLSIGPPAQQTHFADTWGNQITVPHLLGHLEPLQTGMDWQGLRVLAFAGIGRPAKFFATLKTLGADIAATHALNDHQPLNDTLMNRLATQAAALGARLVTTEKDAVRLPGRFQQEVLSVPVRLKIDDWTQLDQALDALGLIKT